MKKILERDGKWYRLLGQHEVIQEGDRLLGGGAFVGERFPVCHPGPLATPKSRNEAFPDTHFRFYREVDYLTAKMIEAKNRAR